MPQSNHWLPATFIGRFSEDLNSKARHRRVWTLQRGESEPRRMTIVDVATKVDLYMLNDGSPPEAVDRTWSYYEPRLNGALTRLLGAPRRDDISRVNTLEWLTVLVPFVTSLLVRGPDFDRRYEERLRTGNADGLYRTTSLAVEEVERYFEYPDSYHLPDPPTLRGSARQDNLNRARLAEMQRLLIHVATGKWTVLHAPSDGPELVLPDTGYLVGGPREREEDLVFTVPVGPRVALSIAFRWFGTLAISNRGTWETSIGHADLAARFVENANEASAVMSENTVIAGTPAQLRPLVSSMTDEHRPVETLPWLSVISRDAMWVVEREWAKLVSTIARYPPGDARVADFAFSAAVWRRYANAMMLTVDRPLLDHVALCTNPDRTEIYGCPPTRYDEENGIPRLTFGEGSPVHLMRGTHATWAEAAASWASRSADEE